jgi:hypothetical protein
MPITPDTKDWTWVLERPCEQCGFDATQFARETISDATREDSKAWIPILEREDVKVRPRDDRWSPLEYACHVRDVYRTFDKRLALMLSEDNPTFPDWDQDATAVAERYDLQDPAAVSHDLFSTAETYAYRFGSVTGSDWERPGIRSNGSHFTVSSLALYGLHDSHHHLWDVREPS